jgi:hypothetical protein
MIKNFLELQQAFIENWAKSPEKEFEKSIFSTLKSVNSKIKPFLDYLPEPYLGHPYKSDGVFLNYNPGPVFKDDSQHRNNGLFVEKYKGIDVYNYFAINTPYFEETSGFWADRKRFLSRLLNKSIENTSLFALEICPFHSSSFKLSAKDIVTASSYIENNVLKIAEEVAKHTTLKTIITVGKDYYHLFNFLNYKLIGEIDQTTSIDNWPKNKLGTKINRSISLWQSPSGGMYFNTWAPGSNKISSKEFDSIINKQINNQI